MPDPAMDLVTNDRACPIEALHVAMNDLYFIFRPLYFLLVKLTSIKLVKSSYLIQLNLKVDFIQLIKLS